MKKIEQESLNHQSDVGRQQQDHSNGSALFIKKEEPNQYSMELKYSPNPCMEGATKMEITSDNSAAGNVVEQYMQHQNQFLAGDENNTQDSAHLDISAEALNQDRIKSEPMDYEQSITNISSSKIFTSTSVSLSKR